MNREQLQAYFASERFARLEEFLRDTAKLYGVDSYVEPKSSEPKEEELTAWQDYAADLATALDEANATLAYQCAAIEDAARAARTLQIELGI